MGSLQQPPAHLPGTVLGVRCFCTSGALEGEGSKLQYEHWGVLLNYTMTDVSLAVWLNYPRLGVMNEATPFGLIKQYSVMLPVRS